MKKNKILIGVISIMFAGIITLGIIECNNSNTKDNDKLFIGNGKFCQAKRLNGLGAIYDDDYIFFDCENQIYESYNYSNKKNDKKLNVNCRNSACSHSNDTCEAYVELGEYFVFNSKIYKYYNKSKVVSGENRLYGSIVEEESGKTVFKNSIPTDMSSELAIDDSEANVSVQSVEKAYQEAYNKYLTDIERVRGSGAVNRVTNDYLNSISSNIKRVDLSLMDLDSAKEVSKHLVALDKQWISTLQEVDVVDSLGFSVAGVCQPYIDVWERTKNDKDLYSRIKYAWKEIKPKEVLKYWEEDTKSAPYNYNSLVDKKNAMLQTIYHEYGHSILGGKVSEYYHTNSEVYEAVKKIERKYKRETSKYKTVMQNARFGWDKYEGMDQDERNKIAKEAEDKLKEVYVSKYANDSTGEFIAECFANACLCSNPSPYSVEVYELLKKYFGK